MILQTIISFIKCFLDYSTICWLLSAFFRPRKKLGQMLIIIATSSLILLAVNQLYIVWLNTLVSLLEALCLALLLFEGPRWQRCACAVLGIIVALVCEFVPALFGSISSGIALESAIEHTIQNAYFCLISTGVFFLIVSLVRYAALRNESGPAVNRFVLLVPVQSVLFTYFMLYVDIYLPISKVKLFVYMCAYIFIIGSNVLVVLGDHSAAREAAFEAELAELRHKEALTQALIEQQNHYIEEINGLAHDFRRQLDGIRYELSDPVIQEQIKEAREAADAIRCFDEIKSLPLRVIISRANNRCMELGIEFDIELKYTNIDFMSYPDIYAFFDNALENAIEACENITDPEIKKNIHLLLLRKEDMLYVEISNSAQTAPSIVSGQFQTSKVGGRRHGYGTKNIFRIARKYNASIDFNMENNIYIITCIFPIRKSNK